MLNFVATSDARPENSTMKYFEVSEKIITIVAITVIMKITKTVIIKTITAIKNDTYFLSNHTLE